MYYLLYQIKNEAPLRLADDSIAKEGQTGTLHYIPGSAIRGYVLNAVSKKGFLSRKDDLFSGTYFLNAYPTDGKQALIPSPKGFYEDKAESEGKKQLENVLVGADIEGLKRARIGEFCNIDDETIKYYRIQTSGDLKINMSEEKMFRNEYIDKGYVFEGTIASEDNTLLEKLEECLKGTIYLGNGRSSGTGKCRMIKTEMTDSIPYSHIALDSDTEGECYMMLLSPVAMVDDMGENVGLNIKALESMMGVTDLGISLCSTSIKNFMGYNRTWGGAVPSEVMYDKGSIFRFTFNGVFEKSKLQKIMDSGIGIKLQEGFGRVIFLKKYEKWKYKEDGGDIRSLVDNNRKEATDKEVITLVARKYYRELIESAMDKYIVSNPLPTGGLGASKLRSIEPILTMNRYDYCNAVSLLNRYFEHEQDKEVNRKFHKEHKSTRTLKDHVFAVLDGDLEELLGVTTKSKDKVMNIPKSVLLKEETGELKLMFLLKELRYNSRIGQGKS